MKPAWTTPGLVDLAHFLREDGPGDPADWARRERALYQEQLAADFPQADLKDARFLHAAMQRWLAARRADTPKDELLPAPIVRDSLPLLFRSMGLLGLLMGMVAALGLLHYDGTAPLNVSRFISVLIFGQLVLLVILGGLRLMPRPRPNPLLRSLWERLLQQGTRAAARGLPAEQRARATRLFAARGGLLPRIFPPVIFRAGQGFGVGFNFGALAATLGKVLTSDLAFGWQSTIQGGAQTVHRIAALLATPWAGFYGEGQGFPSLAQIEGSRIVLKDGLQNLTTPDLVAWWPFLCLCLLCYGLLPRLLLWGLSPLLARRSAMRLLRESAEVQQVLRRMITPLLEEAPAQASDATEHPSLPLPLQQDADPDPTSAPRPALILVPEDLAGSLTTDTLHPVLAARGFTPEKILTLPGLSENSQTVFETLEMQQHPTLLIQEGWQPPIREHLDLLRELAMRLSPGCPFALLLIGASTPEAPLPPCSQVDHDIWAQILAEQSIPGLQLLRGSA